MRSSVLAIIAVCSAALLVATLATVALAHPSNIRADASSSPLLTVLTDEKKTFPTPGLHHPATLGVPVDPRCVNTSDPPELVSYHIHILFNANNDGQTKFAMDLQRQFIDEFKVPVGPGKNCSFAAGDPRPEQKTICAYPTSFLPDGPFPTSQYSFFIPKSFYGETVKWILQRHLGVDLLVHPNSGCELQDHFEWSVWGGTPWQLNPTAFNCDSPGCIPPP